MRCPRCKALSEVLDSRVRNGWFNRAYRNVVYRRRRCTKCGTVWSTWESTAQPLEIKAIAFKKQLREVVTALAKTMAELEKLGAASNPKGERRQCKTTTIDQQTKSSNGHARTSPLR